MTAVTCPRERDFEWSVFTVFQHCRNKLKRIFGRNATMLSQKHLLSWYVQDERNGTSGDSSACAPEVILEAFRYTVFRISWLTSGWSIRAIKMRKKCITNSNQSWTKRSQPCNIHGNHENGCSTNPNSQASYQYSLSDVQIGKLNLLYVNKPIRNFTSHISSLLVVYKNEENWPHELDGTIHLWHTTRRMTTYLVQRTTWDAIMIYSRN